LEPAEKLILWTSAGGGIYTKQVSHFVIGVKSGQTAYTEAANSSLSTSQWFYDSLTGVLYIRTNDSSDPKTKNIIVTYRLFYSTIPYSLPYDLDSGNDVYYEGRLTSASAVSQELDEEQIGIALESSTSLSFINQDGHFDETFDTLIWENKRVGVYSWSPAIPITEAQKIFEGIIQDKTFSPSQVQLKCKDAIFQLREPLSLSVFSDSDGEVLDSVLGTPKRRLYGQFKQLKAIPIDCTKDGYALSGTITGAFGSTTITGIGTSFLDQVSPGDNIIIPFDTEDVEVGVESVDSDTQLTLSDELEINFTNVLVINRPDRPWRKKNRRWHIAGHKLRSPSTTIASVDQPNRITVVSASDLFAGDLIDVEGEDIFIKRVIGNQLVLNQALQMGQVAGDSVTKNAVSQAFFGTREAFINRDWTLTNTTEAILEIDDEAELNIAKPKAMVGSFTFTNGSRTVSCTGADLKNDFKPRDWIRSGSTTHATYYEILSVDEDEITLRVAYAGTNFTGSAKGKFPQVLDDESIVAVNCIGLERSGVWIKSAAQAVKDMLQNDADFTNINTASFTESNEAFPYAISAVFPAQIGSDAPKLRDAISVINSSVFGSLTNSIDWELSYSILDPERPTDLVEIKDHDLVGQISVQSKNEIVRKINAKYRPFTDLVTGDAAFESYIFESSFVDDLVGSKAEKSVELLIYDQTAAESVAQRYALYNSLSQSVLTLNGKLNFFLKSLNDKIYLSLDRLYKRFGGRDRRKIGIINKIVKTGTTTTIEINDLGNIFNRVAAIAADTTPDFTSADYDHRIKSGFICDDSLEVPDITSEAELGQNIIG